jgi:riboflavin synthase
MFTGYIDHCGKILHIDSSSAGKRFHIACDFPDLTRGESIAVNGACLTVTDCAPGEFYCDLSPETLAVTTAHQLKPGSLINLERSLRANDRLHGHFVMGHVDQVCQVAAKENFTDYVEYRFSGVLQETRHFLVRKGSITVNGVSLTLNTISQDTFAVMLIPETLRKTNLSALEPGDVVNVEYDYLAKIVKTPVSDL